MAEDNFERCLAATLQWEGGYSNHPDDPGGPTMKGVIQREYDAWRTGHGQHRQSVRLISEDEVRAIYRRNYWDAMKCGTLPAGIDFCVFDAAVNSGTGRAAKWLAHATSVDKYCDARLHFLQGLGRLWHVFGAGWDRRVRGVRVSAKAMEAAACKSSSTS
jgi:lysozyme family protein